MFTDLPDGTVFSAFGGNFRINYTAHTVTLTKATAPPSAGKVNIKIKLTKAGKKALEKAKRAKHAVKVTGKTGFTPTGGTKTSATTHFKLKK